MAVSESQRSRGLNADGIPRVPKIGVPFLDAIQVVHGPPGLLGRFFLQAERTVRQKGLTLEFAAFDEMAQTNSRYIDNWGHLIPMFDPRVSDIPADRAMCLAVRDAKRDIVAMAGGKYFDATERSFKRIVEDGDFFSLRPVDGQCPVVARMHAPIADSLYGDLAYCGGIWVHPDVRGLRLPALISRIVNACMLTLWDPDYVMGFVKPDVLGSDLHKRYGYERAEPSLIVHQADRKLYEGIFLWMTRTDATIDLADFLERLWPQIDPTVIA
jgi:hypothetical protein